MTQLQQTLREQARFPWQETTVQDIGGAFRYFRRNLGFFAVAAVISALGIGAMTAVFSVAETLLLRPLCFGQLSTWNRSYRSSRTITIDIALTSVSPARHRKKLLASMCARH